jgi:hypothetical protein
MTIIEAIDPETNTPTFVFFPTDGGAIHPHDADFIIEQEFRLGSDREIRDAMILQLDQLDGWASDIARAAKKIEDTWAAADAKGEPRAAYAAWSAGRREASTTHAQLAEALALWTTRHVGIDYAPILSAIENMRDESWDLLRGLEAKFWGAYGKGEARSEVPPRDRESDAALRSYLNTLTGRAARASEMIAAERKLVPAR